MSLPQGSRLICMGSCPSLMICVGYRRRYFVAPRFLSAFSCALLTPIGECDCCVGRKVKVSKLQVASLNAFIGPA